MAKKRHKKRPGASRRPQPRRPSGPVSVEEQPLTSVIIPVCNQLDYTKLCIESLLEHTPPERFELIVIDNGSDSDTADYLQSLARQTADAPRVKLMRFNANQGIAPAWNAGIRVARGSYYAFVDNDVLFSQGWLDGLLAAFEREDVWAAVPNMSHVFVPHDFGRRAPDMLAQPLMTQPESLVGTFFVVPKRVVDRIGSFDERFGIGPYADLDFEFRLKTRGKTTVRVDNVCVHHFEGRTVTTIPHFFDAFEERNRRHIEAKWQLSTPLPPMSEDFEFELWLKKVRTLPPPDPEEIRRRAGFDPDEWRSDRPPRIIACVNVFNDMKVLPDCLASIEGVDEVCIVDGAYATVPHEKPYSTDGTLEYVKELSAKDHRMRVIECTEAWKNEATKRSAYFIGGDGDWYLLIDADEQLVTSRLEPGGLAELQKHLAGCTLDAHFLDIYEPATMIKMTLPRVFRHQSGLRYDAAHWNLLAGQTPVAPDWSAPLIIHDVAILHRRERRDRQRLKVQDDYYEQIYLNETAEFMNRIKELESSLTGDGRADAATLELIWTYYTHAAYQRQYHTAQHAGQPGTKDTTRRR